MGLLEGLLYMIWRGMAIGIIISAPMGPVGILCVQRTLEKGRKTGFYTGIGAALSDLIYCLLTGFGLSFIEEFLERNSNIIQLLGSLVLIGFGVYLFKSNPSKNLKRPSDKSIPAGKNILSGFLFTFSNPLIIFLIIGLFARFNFLLPEISFFHYIFGFLCIIGGALLWWWVVTYFVDKVRAHFNLRSMWLINKITGSVIMLFAVVGIITAISGMANASSPRKAVIKKVKVDVSNNKSGIKSETINLSGCKDFEMTFRVRNIHNAERKGYEYIDSAGNKRTAKHPAWRMKLGNETQPYEITVRTSNDPFEVNYAPPQLQFTLKRGEKTLAGSAFTAGFNMFEGLNAYRLRVKDGELTMRGGNKEYEVIIPPTMLEEDVGGIRFEVDPGGKLNIEHLTVRDLGIKNLGNEIGDESQKPLPEIEILKDRFKESKDEKEGIWGVLDYNVDDTYLKMGGEYVVAIIKEEPIESSAAPSYNIYYLSGGEKYPDLWKYGERKGRLNPTPFPYIYNLDWLSAKGEKVLKSIKVEFDNRDMLINIPDYSSSIRFRKIYPEK